MRRALHVAVNPGFPIAEADAGNNTSLNGACSLSGMRESFLLNLKGAPL